MLRRKAVTSDARLAQKLQVLRCGARHRPKQMAAALGGVSAAYLSALEHGRRGAPGWPMVQKIIGYFIIIWDDAEELGDWRRSPTRAS